MKNLILLLLLIVFSYSISKECCCSRWAVKTLSDDAASLIDFANVTQISFKKLMKIDSVAFKGNKAFHKMTRRPDEMMVVKIKCKLIKWVKEDDGDYHVVVCNPTKSNQTMICEIPDPDCPESIKSGHAQEYRECRDYIDALPAYEDDNQYYLIFENNPIVFITGIPFHDFKHRTKDHAPNFLELHPVIKIDE